jgi:hypothetical protein
MCSSFGWVLASGKHRGNIGHPSREVVNALPKIC